MSADNGFNPMRWDCDRWGCFNRVCRPKIEKFADCFPGRINFGDLVAIVEVSGNTLVLEWKSRQCEREFVSEFRGLAGTAKQKKVLQATGLGRASLSTLRNGDGLDAGLIRSLLAAMRENSAPVKPEQLGIIGKAHLQRRFAAAGCEMQSFDYRRVVGCSDGLPWVIETAFGWCPEASYRRLDTGVNWTAALVNPFRVLGRFGASLDTILSQQRADLR